MQSPLAPKRASHGGRDGARRKRGMTMKKRLLSILLMCCMVLTLLPTTAFAEESTETPPVCSCETACTAESRNAECPVCGAEGASAENCAKYIKPADDAAVQPEGEVSDPQPKTALTALIGGSETVTDVSTADELTAAIADSNVSTVRLAGDISISRSLTVTRTVTLDLNGHVLQMTGNDSDPVIEVKKDSIGVGIGNLALTDSNPNTAHKFTPNADGLWVLNEENGTKTVNGGVITGSKEIGIWVDGGYGPPLTQKPAEADCAHLIMTGGNIVGCAAEAGGGVCASFYGYFTMSGGSIRGCVAKAGGGVCLTNSASFAMGGNALIADCISTDGGSCGGGGIGADLGALVALSGNAVIKNCTAQHGGGVYLNNATLTMSENASVTGCNSIAGGGVSARGNATESDPPVFAMEGSSSITDCTALNGGGIFVSTSGGKVSLSGSAKIENCRAVEKVKLEFPDVTGGGVHVSSGSFEMSGGSIESCTAVNGGDSVFVFTGGNSKFTMTGGTVDGSITMPYTVGNEPVYMDGLGTAVSPYQISTADQLKLFRDIVNGSNGQTQNTAACATLTADIVLNDGTFDEDGNYTPGPSGAALTEWSPMGVSNSTVYAGTFDGAGHTIQGLYCNSNSHAPGLFGYIAGATIQDIRVTGHFNADKAEHAGCIVAYSQNSRITGCVSTASINGHHSFQSATGGIVGIADSSTQVSDCINYGTVKCITSESNFTNAGGIVGWLAGSSNITNCSNFGTVIGLTYGGYVPPIYVGGIVGSAWTKSISDCYNAGAVRIDEQGNSSAAQEAGGIAGFAGFNDTYPLQISNCYNVGSVTAANANAMLGGIVGCSGYDSVAITNCYYLTGTAGQVYGYGKATVTATTEKSAFDFGNGTVLALLINSRADSEHPWNSQCQYLAAAGKTLPVFKTQTGDKHTHDWSVWTSNGNGTHSRRCTCNAVETQNCSGGTATCTAKAKCADCGAEYGDTNPNHYGDKLKHVVAKDATTSEEGNIEYWYCEACGKYFSDNAATKEITQAETVIPKRQSSGSNYSYYTIKATAGTGGAISPSGNVSVRGGRDQTFTITPDKGYAVANVKIDGKSIGAVKSYTFENVRRTHTIEVIFMKANGNPQTGVFVDVATGSYYEDAVDWAVENGITKGTDDTHFSPDGICTRAQAVTFLWRAAGSPKPETRTMPFADVPAGSYYYDAVLWAVENGITKGTSDTTFSPNAICTRAQSVTFLHRASGSPAVSGSAEFSDVSTTAFYADAVAWAAKKGITTGIGGGLFGSDNDCTRSQIVTFLWRCKK